MNADQYRALSTFAEDVLTREARWKSTGNQAKRRDAGKTVTPEKAGTFDFDLKLADMIMRDGAATARARAAAAFILALRRYGSALVWIDPRVTKCREFGTIADDVRARHISEIRRTGNDFAKLSPRATGAGLLARLEEDMDGDPWVTTTTVLVKGRPDVYASLLAAPSGPATTQGQIDLISNLQLALRNETLSNDLKRFATTTNEFYTKQALSLHNSASASKPRRPRRTPLRRLLVDAFSGLRSASPEITLHGAIASLIASPFNGLRIGMLRNNARDVADENASEVASESLNKTQLKSLFKVAKEINRES